MSIKFYKCDAAKYANAVSENKINEDGIYYIEDEGVIYKGSTLYGPQFNKLEGLSTADSVSVPHSFYYDPTTGEVRYYTSETEYIIINESAATRASEIEEVGAWQSM